MIKVYMKIKGQVFECLPSQTEITKARRWKTIDNTNVPIAQGLNSFSAAVITPQPWSCKMQKAWSTAMDKKIKVKLVMVMDDSADEYTFKDVDVTSLSNIDDSTMGIYPIIPVIEGSTSTEIKKHTFKHAWWQV